MFYCMVAEKCTIFVLSNDKKKIFTNNNRKMTKIPTTTSPPQGNLVVCDRETQITSEYTPGVVLLVIILWENHDNKNDNNDNNPKTEKKWISPSKQPAITIALCWIVIILHNITNNDRIAVLVHMVSLKQTHHDNSRIIIAIITTKCHRIAMDLCPNR